MSLNSLSDLSMGNATSNNSRNPSTSGGSRKVIFWNGTVAEFSEPLTVAELMIEHPKQVVMELRPDCIAGKTKPTPLPADQNLDPNKLYVMVPLDKRGKLSAFSGEEARRLLVVANISLRRARTGPRFLPLLVRVCAGPGKAAAAAVSDTFSVRKKNKKKKKGGCVDDDDDDDDVAVVGEKWGQETDMSDECEGGTAFLMSGRRWKPSLDTIVEKEMVEISKKVNHWLF